MAEFSYGVYGIALKSDFPLTLPLCARAPLAEVALRRAAPGDFDGRTAGVPLTTRDQWYEYAHLEDGSSYVRWRGLGEFLVGPGGAEISCIQAPEASDESFQVYLLGRALSFALVRAGFEPLHGTAIVHEGKAIAFLGDSGFGKSTLAAGFLSEGAALLTDDVLMVRPVAGQILAYPGPARIKLMPDAAARYLPSGAAGVPMNALSNKHVIPLGPARHCSYVTPLRSVYALAAPNEIPGPRLTRIEPMSRRAAFVTLVASTLNRSIADCARLKRQFAATTLFSGLMPLSTLTFHRSADRFSEIREAVLAHRGVPSPEVV